MVFGVVLSTPTISKLNGSSVLCVPLTEETNFRYKRRNIQISESHGLTPGILRIRVRIRNTGDYSRQGCVDFKYG